MSQEWAGRILSSHAAEKQEMLIVPCGGKTEKEVRSIGGTREEKMECRIAGRACHMRGDKDELCR